MISTEVSVNTYINDAENEIQHKQNSSYIKAVCKQVKINETINLNKLIKFNEYAINQIKIQCRYEKSQ